MPISTRLIIALFLIIAAPTIRAQALVPDPSFSSPLLETTFPEGPLAINLTALPDGGVLVTTTADAVDAKAVSLLCKLRADGSVDTAFRTPVFKDIPIVSYVYSDGRLLVHDGDKSLVRLLANGALDPSYRELSIVDSMGFRILPLSDGRLVATFGQRIVTLQSEGGFASDVNLNGRAYDAFLQPDGKIIIAGTIIVTGRGAKVARLNADGSIDTSFDSISALSNAGEVRSVIALPDGTIVVGAAFGPIRLMSNGAYDPSYVSTPDRLIYAGGFSRLGPGSSKLYYYISNHNSFGALIPELRRLDAGGTLDSSFNVPGVTLPSTAQPFPFASWDEKSFYFIAALTTDRAHQRLAVIRTDANGVIDPRFNPRFSRRAASAWRIVRQPDGKYVVAGALDHANGTAIHPEIYNCIRLNADGSLDRGFQAPPTTIINQIVHIVIPQGIQPDGRLIVGGDGGIYRLNVDGSRDTSFPILSGREATVLPDGSFIAAEANGRMSRYSRNGIRDTSFDAGNAYGLGFLAIAPDGKIYTGRPARFLPNGAPDPSWVDSTSIPLPATINYAMLGNGTLLVCAEMRSNASSPWHTRLVHLDAAGRSILSIDLPNELPAIARAAWELATANGGGDFKLQKRGIQVPGSILIRGNEITIAPEIQPNGTVTPPLASISRFLASSTVHPQSSRAPTIFQQPVSKEVARGTSIALTVQAFGQLDFTYQWFKDGIPLGTATTSSGIGVLTLNNVQPADAGSYHAEVRNPAGAVVSTAARIRLVGSPVVLQEPELQFTLTAGQTIALTLALSGNGMRVRWMRGDTVVSDETGIGAGMHTSLFTVGEGGVYRALISNTEGETRTREVSIAVNPNAARARLSNVSIRTEASSNDRSLIVGFAVEGDSAGSLGLLIRGIGPALASFGVTGFMPDPRIALRSSATLLDQNDDWGGVESTRAVAMRVGAFPLTDGESRDAALTPSLGIGSYTVQIEDAQGTTGTVLAEIYNTSPSLTNARLVNLSSRAHVRSRNEPLIAGFVIAGDAAQTVLLRGIGPGLAPFGVRDTLPQVELVIFDAQSRKIAESAGYPRSYSSISARVGAFALSGDSVLNAALAVTLQPGAYTVQLRGPLGAAGTALVEIYEIR
ncbi:MAG: immunoglobulin domain-containing protein [Verrucomicrobiota bacterium]